MNQLTRLLSALSMAALLAGCAGTNFKRPEADALHVGTSTQADVSRVMGAPQQTGELLKNDQKVTTLRYVYAEGAGTGRYPGVVPARAMVFSIFNNTLVSQEFVSSFPADATEYDESHVSQIAKGKSTRAEVRAMIGRPNGEAVHPIVKNKGERADIYSYSHAKGSVFDMKFYSKILIVSYNGAGVVTDYEYVSNGVR